MNLQHFRFQMNDTTTLNSDDDAVAVVVTKWMKLCVDFQTEPMMNDGSIDSNKLVQTRA